MCVYVFHTTWEPSTSHLVGVLLQTPGCAVLNVVQFGHTTCVILTSFEQTSEQWAHLRVHIQFGLFDINTVTSQWCRASGLWLPCWAGQKHMPHTQDNRVLIQETKTEAEAVRLTNRSSDTLIGSRINQWKAVKCFHSSTSVWPYWGGFCLDLKNLLSYHYHHYHFNWYVFQLTTYIRIQPLLNRHVLDGHCTSYF